MPAVMPVQVMFVKLKEAVARGRRSVRNDRTAGRGAMARVKFLMAVSDRE